MMEVRVIEKDQCIPGAACRISTACVGPDDERLQKLYLQELYELQLERHVDWKYSIV